MAPMDEPRRRLTPVFPPAQQYALLGGAFVLALGILSLIFEDLAFGAVGPLVQQPEFLIWPVNGWTAVFWIAIGAAGVLSSRSLEGARTYAVTAGGIFAAMAVWGLINGDDVVGLFVAETADNVTNAVLGATGLLAAALPPGSGAGHGHATTNGAAPRTLDSDRRVPTGGFGGPR